MSNIMREAASVYLNFELPILPLCSSNHAGCSDRHILKCKSPGKVPLLKEWTKRTTTTEEEVEQWFKMNPHINLGLQLGQTDNYNLIGIDIDGQFGEELFAQITEQKELPDTWEFTTGAGRRLIYQIPMGVETKKNRIDWQPGHSEVALIAQGQQTVLPPSSHVSGRLYTWIDEHSPLDCDVAMAPNWLIDLVRTGRVLSDDEDTPEDLPFDTGTKSKPVVIEETSADIAEGGRSNALTRIIGSLCAKRNIPKEVIIQTALAQNKEHCKPPLSEQEVLATVDAIFNNEMKKHQQILEKQRKRAEANPVALTNSFIKFLEEEKQTYWRYNETKGIIYSTKDGQGPWVQLSIEAAQAEIHSFLCSQDPMLATTRNCKELYQQVIIYSLNNYGNGSELDLGENPYYDWVAVRNGVLNWKEKKLVSWTPAFNHTTCIQADWKDEDYKQSTAYETWSKALHDWLPQEETIMFLQEYIGYTLLPSCKMRTAVFLSGDGSNGKSLFLDAVRVLFEGTTVVTQPIALSARFGTACIVDKLLIMCSDIDSKYLDSSGVLKQLIAGDRVRGEYKGGKEFDFTPVGKLLFSANKLPKSADKTGGWHSRIQIVDFPHVFTPNPKYYMEFLSTISSEEGRAMLLGWAVEGLIRLTENGKWTLSADMNTSKENYKEDNDNVLGFVHQQLEPKPVVDEGAALYTRSLHGRALYDTYKDWCDEQGLKALGYPEFLQRCKSMLGTQQIKWKTKKGWQSVTAVVNYQFKETDSYNGRDTYQMNVNLLAM